MKTTKTTRTTQSNLRSLRALMVGFFLTITFFSSAQSITVDTPASLCAGQSVVITFDARNGNGSSSRFNSSSLFTVTLRDDDNNVVATLATNFTFASFSTANGATTNNVPVQVTIPATVTSDSYRIRVACNAPNRSAESSQFNITNVAGGTITGSTSVCTGSGTTLNHNAPTGSRQWQVSTDGTNFSDITNNGTNSNLSTGNLTATRHYRVRVTENSCTAFSPVHTVTVNPATAAGSISGATAFCAGGSTTLTIAGHIGTVQWQRWSIATFQDINGATGTTLNVTQAGTYRARLSGCGTATTNSLTVTVDAAPVAGTVSGAATVCAGTNNTVLTLTGSTGSRQWQSSTDNINFTNIAGTTGTTFTAANLSTTTFYRCVLSSGVCTPVTSNSVAVTVTPQPVAGTISGNNTLCSGTNTTTLTLSGHTGTIQWQQQINGTFQNISGANAATLTRNNLTATTTYRAVLTSGPCTSATTAPFTVTVNPVSVAGTIAGNNTLCSGNNSTTLTLSGQTGTIQWQEEINGTFENISGANAATLTLNNLTATTTFRAAVTSGTCQTAFTSPFIVTVQPTTVAGTISGPATVCPGANSVSLTLNGNTGTIQWQELVNGTYQDISGATSQSLVRNNITVTSTFRAAVTSGFCGTLFTDAFTVTLLEGSFAGTISGDGMVCPGTPVVLTLNNSRGNIQWQSSTDAVEFTDIAGATSTILSINEVTDVIYYRAVVTNNNCTPAETSAVTLEPGQGTTWNGTEWSHGEPHMSKPAIIAGNYNENTDLTACTLTVTNNAQVVIRKNRNLELRGALNVVSGSVLIENRANLIQTDNVQNTGNISIQRETLNLRRLDYVMWSAPITGQTLQGFSPLTSATPTSRFYTYNTETNFYNSITTPGSHQFEMGKSYLIRVPNNHSNNPAKWTGTFTGVPNNGNITVALADHGDGKRYNAVGNPYPSPLSVDAFLAANSANIKGALYLWRKRNGSSNSAYATYNNGVMVSNGDENLEGELAGNLHPFGASKSLGVGQGFIVEAKAGATQLVFNNSMRTDDNNVKMMRSAQPTGDRLWVNLTNAAGVFSQMAVVYDETATTNATDDFDAKLFSDSDNTIAALEQGEKYVINGRSAFQIFDVVPVAVKAETAGTHTISIARAQGRFAGSQVVLLHDKLTGAIVNLRKAGYTFLSEAGEFNNRFEIRYQRVLMREAAETPSKVMAYAENGNMHISTGVENMKSVKVIDLTGREVVNTTVSGTIVTVPFQSAPQILIIQATLENGTVLTTKVKS